MSYETVTSSTYWNINIATGSVTNISGGTFKSNSKGNEIIHANANAEINISGGNFINENKNGRIIYVHVKYAPKITVTGGTFDSDAFFATGSTGVSEVIIEDGQFKVNQVISRSNDSYKLSENTGIYGGIYNDGIKNSAEYIKKGHTYVENTDESTNTEYPYTIGPATYYVYFHNNQVGSYKYNPEAHDVDLTVTPDSGYTCLSQVIVRKVPYVTAGNSAGGTTVTIG